MRFNVIKSAGFLAVVLIWGGEAPAADHVTFALNWVPYGLHYGIFAAETQGYYTSAGLDVDIQRGYGSGDTVKRVATGSADIGMADMASVISGNAAGFRVKELAVILDRSADAIFYVQGAGIRMPSDLEGHSLGATASETAMNLFPVFAANAGLDSRKVEIVNLAPPAKFPALVSRTVDAIVAFTTEEPAIQSAASKTGVRIGRFLYSDHGVDYYSIGLIASDDALAKKGDVLRHMVDATLRGYAWAIKNPDAAADIYAKRFPESSRDLTLAQWKITIQHMLTDNTRANGVGAMSGAKVEKTIELLAKYQNLNASIVPDDIYTTKLLDKIEVPK